MKRIKDNLIAWALILGMPALTYLGFRDGVDGARYVVTFFVWVICLPVGLLALSESVQKSSAQKSVIGPARRFISRAGAWASLTMMVWSGSIATAGAWSLFMLCAAVHREGIKKYRAAQTSENHDA